MSRGRFQHFKWKHNWKGTVRVINSQGKASFDVVNEGEILTLVTINKDYKNGLVTAIVVDGVGNISKGHALCDEADTFNEDFGTALAVARAEERYNKKQVKMLLKYGL